MLNFNSPKGNSAGLDGRFSGSTNARYLSFPLELTVISKSLSPLTLSFPSFSFTSFSTLNFGM